MKLFNYQSSIIQKVIDFAKIEYEKNDSFHSWQHVENVMKRADEIAEKIDDPIDFETLKLAIIFHDIDYHSEKDFETNYSNHVDNSVKVAKKFLNENNYPKEKIEKVKDIILDHSTPHRKKQGEAKSIEGKIIYDSDKSIFITNQELFEKYFPQLYLEETKEMVKIKK
ncbi:MAG: HD domain-containing protein [Patescibacteria group bacterium]